MTTRPGENYVVNVERTGSYRCPVSGRVSFELSTTIEIGPGNPLDYYRSVTV